MPEATVTNGAASPKTPPSTSAQKAAAKPTRAPRPGKAEHNTRRVPESVLQRLQTLVKNGTSVKTAAEKLDMGYSTAQRYARVLLQPGATAEKIAKQPATLAAPRNARDVPHGGSRYRLSTKRIDMIKRMLNAKIDASTIVKRAGVSLSSVYKYQRELASLGTSGEAEESHEQGIPAISLAEMRAAYKHTYNSIWSERREATASELRWLLTYLRMTDTPTESD